MSFIVRVGRPAEKFLRALTDKKLYQRLREAIDALEQNPGPLAASSSREQMNFIGFASVITASSTKSTTSSCSCL